MNLRLTIPPESTELYSCDELNSANASYQQRDTLCNNKHESEISPISLPNPDGSHLSLSLSPSINLSSDFDIDSPLCDDFTSLMDILSQTKEIEEDILFTKHGYTKIEKICDTLQGELIKAKVDKDKNLNQNNIHKHEYVAIKKICKVLTHEKLAYDPNDKDDNITFCVEENIIKEAQILKYLTVDNQSTFNYIIQFIELFESDTHYYMVTEYIQGMNLKQFTNKAHQYIQSGQLSLNKWQKTVKFIMWQLLATFQSLHDVYHCMCNISVICMYLFMYPLQTLFAIKCYEEWYFICYFR